MFAPMPVEPDLMPLLEDPRTWVFPKISGDSLTLWAVQSPEQLRFEAHGLHEPNESLCVQVDPSQLDWILVPGLGFGRDGSRLGRGKGYYDRLLSQAGDRAVTIGVAFNEQIEGAMPCDEWDRPVSELVTDREWWSCGGTTSDCLSSGS